LLSNETVTTAWKCLIPTGIVQTIWKIINFVILQIRSLPKITENQLYSNSSKILVTGINLRATLDEGPLSRDQWIQAILLVPVLDTKWIDRHQTNSAKRRARDLENQESG
jgi:hypothetical protein